MATPGKRSLLLGCVVALALTASAHAAGLGVAEVRAPNGSLAATAGVGPFSYGRTLQIGSAVATGRGVELRNVSMLGGRIWVGRIFVPYRGLQEADVATLIVGGRTMQPTTNGLIPLAPHTYLVVLQKAVIPGRHRESAGVVGVRLYVGDPGLGVKPGTQLLVGVAHSAVRARGNRHQLPASILGFAPGQLLAAGPSVPEPFSPRGNSVGARVVAIAERYLGVPYVWGGADPLTGFDCSGFTMFVYHQLGIDLTHFSGAQWYEGARVPPGELQPGDLVFFEAGANGPGHEGIYIGGGRFIHAPHTGDVVKISSLSEPWYALQYVGAVRPTSR